MAGQTTGIADVYARRSELAVQEQREVGRIVSMMLPVMTWLNEPVVLKPRSLGSAFQEFSSVSLENGEMVVMTDVEGNVSRKNLAQLPIEECLAILQSSLPELQKMAEHKRRREEQAKPALSMKIVLGGTGSTIEVPSYRLVVSNSGGDCTDIRVTTMLPGGWTRTSPPCDVRRGEQAEVDLGVFEEVSDVALLQLQVECKDAEGRELRGSESLPLNGAEWQEAFLRRKS
jgi:hypothetical protein